MKMLELQLLFELDIYFTFQAMNKIKIVILFSSLFINCQKKTLPNESKIVSSNKKTYNQPIKKKNSYTKKNVSKNNLEEVEIYENTGDYFIKTFDLNKDGIADKIISSKSYAGNDLLIFLGNRNNSYKFVLKTTNFSADGGNQISDIKQTNDGFEIITRFPDRGNSQSNYYVIYSNDSFILKKIVDEYYSWQDKYTENCVRNINFDLKNAQEALSEAIATTQENCIKKYDK